ncbi:type II secretion system protein GspM [Pseudomonas sp. F3-2]|uniref:type II secretion system protein GspM n=1 Tax=Pseudomonas sp. F3-2 TaxID=3141539 RepID=UPI00315D922A
MRRPLDRNARRIAALSVLALLLWAGWSVLIDSWFATPMADLDQQLQVLQTQHQRYAAALAQAPAVHAELERARQDPASRRSLLPGDDPSAVAADLMQVAVDRIKPVAALGPGCDVTQRVPIIPEQDSAQAYRQVKVSLTLECGTEPLMQLLHSFEYGQPSLFVEALNVSRAVNAQPVGTAGRLKVQLLLRGYLTAASGRPTA